jgi:endo-1,4-beta-xylanase
MKKTLLYLVGSLLFSNILTAQTATQNTKTLKDAYKGAFKIGCSVNDAIVRGSDSISRRLVLQQFNTITPENVLKAETVHPRPDVWNFGAADAFAKMGEDNHLFVVGHTLIWHNQTPDWFFKDEQGKPKSHDAMVEQMRSYIATVVGRYKNRINAWDVVNEQIDENGAYRSTSWVNAIGNGDELMKLAFKFAHQYAPDAQLYYNDFNVWRPSKRDGIARMVRMLKKEGIRIDGIGIQGHWGLNFPKKEYIEAAIDTFATLGVKVMITELDVDVLPITKEGQLIGKIMSDPQWQHEEFKTFLDPYRNGLPADMEKQLADRYAELFGIFYNKRDKIDRVTVWGLHDGMSWKNDYPVPGRINYPLLYRRDKTPKLALDAVLAVPAQAKKQN